MYHTVLVLVLMCLIITGLNISNQGINHLTGQNREAVLGLSIDKKNINLHVLGERFSYCTDELVNAKTSLFKNGKEFVNRGKAYMCSLCIFFLVIDVILS